MSDPWIYIWVKFGGVDADEIMEHTMLTKTPVTPVCDFESIFTAFTADTVHCSPRLKNESGLHLLLSELTELFPSDIAKTPVDYLRLAKKYVSANLNRPELTVAELSRAVGVERSYLFRLFKEGEGVSVKEYIINKRLESARDMFERGITQVNVVAFSCGYDDPLYFSGAFKKKYGMSPRNFILKKIKKVL